MVKSFFIRLHKLRSNLNLKRILKLIWSVSRKWTIISVLFIFIETALYFVSLYLLKLLVDAVSHPGSNQHNHEQIIRYILWTLISGVLYFVIKSISAYITEIQAAYVAEYLNDKIHQQTILMDLAFYESPDYFDILKRAMDAGTHRPSQVIISLMEIIKNIMTLMALATVLITIDWFLLPLIIIFIIPTLFIRINFSDQYNIWRIRQTPLERKSAYLSSLITTDQAAKEIRSYNLGPHIKEDYLKIRLKLLEEKLNISKKRTVQEVVSSTIGALGFFLCIAYIVMMKGNGSTEAGNLTVFLVVFPQSFFLLQGLSHGVSTLYQNNIFISSIFDLFDLKPQISEPPFPLSLSKKESLSIELKHVNFSYSNSNHITLRDINLRIQSGKIVAIVGANGAGKSTLIKLICRLYDPDNGKIMMNGVDIRRFRSSEFREQVSVVFQDFLRYQLSARENIHFGDIHAPFSEDKMYEAAHDADASRFIENFPDKYETIMGRIFERGQEPSIGQWQKLAIARCLYSPAHLLIFDEATSSLDALSEQTFFETIRRKLGDRAALIISHRYAATKYADYIYVLEDGKIVESGNNDQLIHAGGEYARLFQEQIMQDKEMIE